VVAIWIVVYGIIFEQRGVISVDGEGRHDHLLSQRAGAGTLNRVQRRLIAVAALAMLAADTVSVVADFLSASWSVSLSPCSASGDECLPT
jgi:hypothetical protein